MSKLDMKREFVPVNFAILTVSDTRSLSEDKSGDGLSERIKGAGHFVNAREITTDDEAKIIIQLRTLVERHDIDVILSTGGTGLTGRDVTVEAHKKIYEKEIDAFGTLFTMISIEKSVRPRYSRVPPQVFQVVSIFSPFREVLAPAKTLGTA